MPNIQEVVAAKPSEPTTTSEQPLRPLANMEEESVVGLSPSFEICVPTEPVLPT